MKKRFIPLLALLLSLCIIVPVSIAQIMAAGAVQINVTAKGGSVVIGDKTVKDGGKHSVSPKSNEDTSITVSIKAVPDEGYAFVGWSEDDSGTIDDVKSENTNLTVNVGTSPVTLTANFQKTLTVTLNQAEGGKATIMKTDKAISSTATTVTGVDNNSGDMVAELTATPNAGYAFSGWKVTYLKNGKEHDAYAKGTNMRYQYVIDGNVSKDSIKVGFNDNGTKMYAIYHVSLIVTPKFTKQLDVTIAESEGGAVTSSNTLTSLASGAQVTFTAAPNKGYGVLGWDVTDKDGNPTNDYTLKMANDTATITLGNTPLKVSAQFSTAAGKFVANPLEANPPTAMLREASTAIQNGATNFSGWNNNKNEELVMTIIPTKDPRTTANANLYMGVWKFAASGYAEGTELKFPDDVVLTDSSDSSNYKLITFKSDCAHPWEEIPFTITDVNGNVKQAKIVLDYPSKGTVSIEGTGKVTVNGSEYANGDVVKAVTGAELTLQATEASTFAGWEVTGMTLTEEQAKANPLTITAPEGSFTIKAKFQTGDSDNVTVQVKLMEGTNDRSSDKFWTEGSLVQRMFDVVLMDDKSFDELVAGGFFGIDKGAIAVDENHNVFSVENGEKVCIKILDFRQKLTGEKKGYVLESLETNIPENDIIGKKTVSERINAGTYTRLCRDSAARRGGEAARQYPQSCHITPPTFSGRCRAADCPLGSAACERLWRRLLSGAGSPVNQFVCSFGSFLPSLPVSGRCGKGGIFFFRDMEGHGDVVIPDAQ